MERVKIHIGDYYVANKPTIIQTLLGSCVSVCLYDRKMGIGGMNHILLPGKPNFEQFDNTARFGVNAMELLINSLMKSGARRKKLVSKVFGGAHIIQAIGPEYSPGARNVDFVRRFLDVERIPLLSSATGGRNARKVLFYSHLGDVLVKTLPAVNFQDVAENERMHKERIKAEMERDVGVTFFER